MPRYFFHLYSDVLAEDEEGRELPEIDAVVAECVREARQLLKASIEEAGRIDLRHYLEVRDERGETVFVLHFEDAVTLQRGEEILNRGSIRLLADAPATADNFREARDSGGHTGWRLSRRGWTKFVSVRDRTPKPRP